MEKNQLQVQQSAPHLLSQKLITSLVLMEASEPEARIKGKMDLMLLSKNLLVEGKPDFAKMPSYPAIKELVASEGENKLIKVLFMLVKDFCSSFNVVRNMNEEQMIEAASMLLHECGTYRLEDYVAMFAMAKRGKLFEVRDRIDLQVIQKIDEAYLTVRHMAGEQLQEQYNMDGKFLEDGADKPGLVWIPGRGYEEPKNTDPAGHIGGLLGAFSAMRDGAAGNELRGSNNTSQEHAGADHRHKLPELIQEIVKSNKA